VSILMLVMVVVFDSPRKGVEYSIELSVSTRASKLHQYTQIYQFAQTFFYCSLTYSRIATVLYHIKKLAESLWKTHERLTPQLGDSKVLSFTPKVKQDVRWKIFLFFVYHMNQYHVLIKPECTDTCFLNFAPIPMSASVSIPATFYHRSSVPLIVCTLINLPYRL
jgi:hypothetical protein